MAAMTYVLHLWLQSTHRWANQSSQIHFVQSIRPCVTRMGLRIRRTHHEAVPLVWKRKKWPWRTRLLRHPLRQLSKKPNLRTPPVWSYIASSLWGRNIVALLKQLTSRSVPCLFAQRQISTTGLCKRRFSPTIRIIMKEDVLSSIKITLLLLKQGRTPTNHYYRQSLASLLYSYFHIPNQPFISKTKL